MESTRHKDIASPKSSIVADDPILRACYECVLDFGVTRVTVADVARRAGVSRMTVYRRHSDLPSLLSTVLREELKHALADTESTLPPALDARGRAALAIAMVTRAVATHPLMQRVIEVDPESLLPIIVARLGSTQRLAREHLSAILISGMASRGGDGSIRDADPDLLALTLVVAAQSFVYSARVVLAEDPRAFDELGPLAGSYLAPEERER